jgi:hypothetical protein
MAHHGDDVCGVCFVDPQWDFNTNTIPTYKSYGVGVFVFG